MVMWLLLPKWKICIFALFVCKCSDGNRKIIVKCMRLFCKSMGLTMSCERRGQNGEAKNYVYFEIYVNCWAIPTALTYISDRMLWGFPYSENKNSRYIHGCCSLRWLNYSGSNLANPIVNNNKPRFCIIGVSFDGESSAQASFLSLSFSLFMQVWSNSKIQTIYVIASNGIALKLLSHPWNLKKRSKMAWYTNTYVNNIVCSDIILQIPNMSTPIK